MENKNYDLIIIGAGPGGLTAGLYAARSGLKTALVSKYIGGTANSILRIENWPGYSGSGSELIKKFYEQLKEYDIDFIIEDVKEINKNKDKNGFLIKTNKKEIKSKSVILATGTVRKKLIVKGEEEFSGKGVSYCATCDAFFFKDKIVAIIGGSDCAAVSALALADIAKEVYVIYRGKELRCEKINLKRLKNKNNVKFFYKSLPVEIKGKKSVEELIIKQKNKSIKIKLDGIFIEIGATPLTEITKNLNLKLDKQGYIIVDENMKTSVSGIFAAGDVTNQKLKQVIVAASQGAIAAKCACDFIKSNLPRKD